MPIRASSPLTSACSAICGCGRGRWSRSTRPIWSSRPSSCPSCAASCGASPAGRTGPGSVTGPGRRLISPPAAWNRAARRPSTGWRPPPRGWWCAPSAGWWCSTWTAMATNRPAGLCSTCTSPRKGASLWAPGWRRATKSGSLPARAATPPARTSILPASTTANGLPPTAPFPSSWTAGASTPGTPLTRAT